MPELKQKALAAEREVELAKLSGTIVGGKFRLERLLGVGGMGGVYEAHPVSGGEPVAVKVLSVADPASRERIAARFAREAKAIGAVSSPHIVSILDAGSDAGRPFIAMELLRGEDLGARLRHLGKLPLRDTLHVAAQILVALGSAHEAGFIHRDLKPDNVFLIERAGDPFFCKLLDFGMSKVAPREGHTLALELTKKGMAVGTPYYMAPEQARALADVDGRADLWALGAILFECLTGRPPIVGSTQEQVLLAICTTDAPDVRALQPQTPERVAKLVRRALTRDREQRFISAWQMLAALVEVAPGEERLIPAKAFTAFDLKAPAMPARIALQSPVAAADKSGPVRAQTMVAAPLPEADQSGPHTSRKRSRPTPTPAPAPPPPTSRAVWIVTALCALMLGIGVTMYVLVGLRHHRAPTTATVPH